MAIVTVKRKLIILGVVMVTILVAIVVSSVPRTQSTVFFSSAQAATNATMPPTLKATFYVTNTANRAVFLQIAAIERHRDSAWIADTQALPTNTFRAFGKVGAHGTVQLSFELPHDPVPTRLRVLVSPDATTVQKAQFALCRLWANFRGEGQYKQLWFRNLAVSTYQVITPEIP